MSDYARGWNPESVDALERLVAPLSNWGRWGPDDELGTTNLLTPERASQAAEQVRTGEVISLGRRLSPYMSSDGRGLMHHMLSSGDGKQYLGGRHASDWLGLTYHGFAVSHLDAPSHQLWGDRMYNDRAAELVTTRGGALANSVEPFARGIVGRGLLLDAPRALAAEGRGWLEPGQALGPEELDQVAAVCGVEPTAGDIVLVRTGRDARASAHGVSDLVSAGTAGLSAQSLVWLSQHDIAVLGSDVATDVMQPGAAPHPMAVHAGALVFLGLPLLDNLWLEQLADSCAAAGRWSFQLVVAALPLSRATGSPVNPIAIL